VYDLEFEVQRKKARYSVEDVDLSGKASYVDGGGRIEINQGHARVGRNDGKVSSIRATSRSRTGG